MERILTSTDKQMAALQTVDDEICEWKLEGDGYYHTTCREVVQSILDIDGMRFCPYCGYKLRLC